MPSYPGFFVTFEGPEGGGKSTQLERLAARLRALGLRVRTTREPGGTDLGRRLRALLLDGEDLAPWAEAYLFAADRAEHVARVIRPALEAGEVVLCDRFVDSSCVYQGIGLGLGVEAIRALNRWAVGGLVPDLTLLLDLPPEVGLARRGRSLNRIEARELAYHRRVREGYLALARAEPERWAIVDAARSPEEVAAAVWAAVRPRLEAWRAREVPSGGGP